MGSPLFDCIYLFPTYGPKKQWGAPSLSADYWKKRERCQRLKMPTRNLYFFVLWDQLITTGSFSSFAINCRLTAWPLDVKAYVPSGLKPLSGECVEHLDCFANHSLLLEFSCVTAVRTPSVILLKVVTWHAGNMNINDINLLASISFIWLNPKLLLLRRVRPVNKIGSPQNLSSLTNKFHEHRYASPNSFTNPSLTHTATAPT